MGRLPCGPVQTARAAAGMSRTERQLAREQHPVLVPAPDAGLSSAAAPTIPFWKRNWPGIVVTLAVAFNAVVLRAETLTADRTSDVVAHTSWVRWAAERIAEGHSPLDGWLPQLALGAPVFHQYEVLPHILGGFIATVSDAATVTRWSTYLLVATWPIAIYIGARLIGFDRRTSVVAAVVASLVSSTTSFGLEWSSYVFRGYGLWAQACAMWLIPIAMGYLWRALDRGVGLAIAAFVLALTICTHFFWGYVAFIWLGTVVLAGSHAFLSRLGRAALVAAGGLLASAWLLVPVFTDLRYVGQSQLTNRFLFDSYGAGEVLEWLVTGKLFDFGRTRLPALTILALIGTGVAVVRFRRDARSRVVLVFTGICLVLFFGRVTFGDTLDLVPGLDELPLHRFIGGVQLGGIFLAAIGAIATFDLVVRWVRHREPTRAHLLIGGAVVVGIALLVPAWIERADYARDNAEAIDYQRAASEPGGDVRAFESLVAQAKQRGDGRIFSGNPVDGGNNFKVGLVSAYHQLLNDHTMPFGYAGAVASLSADTELAFDPDARRPLRSLRRALPDPAEGLRPRRARVTASVARALFAVGRGQRGLDPRPGQCGTGDPRRPDEHGIPDGAVPQVVVTRPARHPADRVRW